MRQYEASKAMRVARTTPIPLTVGTFETRRRVESDDGCEDGDPERHHPFDGLHF